MNKEDRAIYMKKYREENKEKLKLKAAEFYILNKDDFKKYKQDNHARTSEYQKKYRESNKESIQEAELKRTRRKRIAKGKPMIVYENCQNTSCDLDISNRKVGTKFCNPKCRHIFIKNNKK